MTFFENSYEQVNGDGDSHLGTHGVLRCAVEGIDSQMLFDPFEEEFDIPAAAVKVGRSSTPVRRNCWLETHPTFWFPDCAN
jgi:hypothetical protein